MRSHVKSVVLACAALLAQASANAQEQGNTPEFVAAVQAMVEHAGNLASAKPASHFDAWLSDQWVMAALTCARYADLKLDKKFGKGGFKSSGSHRAVNRGACMQIGKDMANPIPRCFSPKNYDAPFVFPFAGMPNNYLFLGDKSKPPINGSTISMGFSCNLTPNSFGNEQLYFGPAIVEYQEPIKQMVMNSPSGARRFNGAFLVFKIAATHSQSASALMLANP